MLEMGLFAEKSRILARTFAVNHGMKWLTLNFRESEAGDGTQRRDSSDWS
jgi:hypothetical protein